MELCDEACETVGGEGDNEIVKQFIIKVKNKNP